MKVLVIGGSGFLGSHLVDSLLLKKNSVTVLDLDKSNWLSKNQKFIKADITNLKDVLKFTKGFDVIYHCAGLADLDKASKDPLKTVTANILGTVNILEACKTNKIKKFIFASTIYVKSLRGGFYRCSKEACENYIKEYSNIYNLKYTILRYGSIYGPRSGLENGLYKIIYRALKTKKVVYNGNENTIREYVHVKDVADISRDIINKRFDNSTIVLTGQETLKVKDLLIMIKEILGSNYKIQYSKKNLNSMEKINHYISTPYSYKEDFTKKIKSNQYVDMGQGIVDLINFIKKN
jgi:UDP-glucose 4-epimerase